MRSKSASWLRKGVRNLVLILAISIILWGGMAGRNSLHAEVYGGIDIGSKGIKCVAVNIENGVREIVDGSQKSEQLGLAGSLQPDGRGGLLFSKETLDDAAAIILQQIDDLKKNKAKEVFAVVSSGLADTARGRDPNTNKPLNNPKALDQLLLHLKSAGIPNVKVIGSSDEARYTFAEIVEQKKGLDEGYDGSKTLMIDVGGGNTKLACYGQGAAVDFGAISLSKALDGKNEQEKAGVIKGVKQEIQEQMKEFPLDSITEVYLSGGPAYIVASLMDPKSVANASKGMLHLTPGNDDTHPSFERQVEIITGATNIEQLFDAVINQPGNKEELVEKNLKNAKGIYTLPQLQAAVLMLKETVAEVKRHSPGAELYFFGDGQTAWIRQFVKTRAFPPTPMKELEEKVQTLQNKLNSHEKRIQDLERAPRQSQTSPTIDQVLSKLENLEHLANLDKLSNLDKLASLERLSNLENLTRLEKLDNLEKLANIEEKLSVLTTEFKSSLEKIDASLTRMEGKIDQSNHIIQDPAARQMASSTFFFLGINAGRQKDWKLALKNFDQALQLDPTIAPAWYYRGICYLNLGNEAEAYASIQRAANIMGDDYYTYAKTCRIVAHVQGPTRTQAERILMTARLAGGSR